MGQRIVFINQSLGIGGAETFNLGLLKWLTKQGIVVDTWVTNSDFAKLLSPHVHSITKIPVILDLIGNWKGLLKALVFLPWGLVVYAYIVSRARGADLILMTGYIEKILVTPLAKLLGIRVVWIEFGPLQAVWQKFFGLPKLLYKLVEALPDVLIVPSLNTKLANQQNQAVVIPCAIDIDSQKNKPDPWQVVCVSRLEQGKGQDLLIAAWKQVHKLIPKAKLRIVGEGQEFANLKLKIRNLKLEKSVELTGYVQDALIEMANASVVVVPTMWPLEGFGMVALEAMAASRPVVGFAQGPLPEIVDSSCGILVPAGHTAKLAEAICSLLQEPAIAAKLGSNGRQKYLKKYTWDILGPTFLQSFGYPGPFKPQKRPRR